MARLIAAGKSACVTIQSTPKKVATARVRHCPRPSQPRKLRGLRRSGVPGCSYGRRTTTHGTREIRRLPPVFGPAAGRWTGPSRGSPRLVVMSSETAAGAGVENVRGVPHGSRGAVVAVGALFAINGLVIGAWAGVLPALRSRLGIDAGTLAVLLFVVGVAAVVSMQVGGRMADRVGARRVTLTVLPLMMVGAAVLAFATSFPVAIVAGVLIGLGNGATDVAMNALGVAVEKARPMPVMSRFHAFWSIGSFAGAAVVFLSVLVFGDENGSVVLPAMLSVAVLAAGALLVTTRWIPETEPVTHTVDGKKERDPAGRLAARRDGGLLRADGGHRLRLVGDPPDRRRPGRPGHRLGRRRDGDAVHGGDAAGRRLGRRPVRPPTGGVESVRPRRRWGMPSPSSRRRSPCCSWDGPSSGSAWR